MSATDIANAFINQFYGTLDTNPSGLMGLYQPTSTLTFEGHQVTGVEAIVQKYASLGPLQHDSVNIKSDVQIGANSSTLLIFVTGKLRIGQDNPLLFAQIFQLVATAPGAYYVHNDMFRLVYG